MASCEAHPLRIDPQVHAGIERWAAAELRSLDAPIEFLLRDVLRTAGKLDEIGGYLYLASLEQSVLSTTAAPEHAQLVRNKATLRRLMSAADKILHESSEERRDVTDQIEFAEKLIFEIAQFAEQTMQVFVAADSEYGAAQVLQVAPSTQSLQPVIQGLQSLPFK